MPKTVVAIFEDGVLKPTSPLNIPEHKKVTIFIKQECGGRLDIARKAAIHISHHYSGRTLREIGARFGIGESGVTRASSRFEAELRGNRLLKKKVNIVIEALNLSRV